MTLRCHLLVHLVHVNSLLEVKLPYDPSCPSVCWLVGRSVCLSVCMSLFQVNSHAPIGLSTQNLPCRGYLVLRDISISNLRPHMLVCFVGHQLETFILFNHENFLLNLKSKTFLFCGDSGEMLAQLET